MVSEWFRLPKFDFWYFFIFNRHWSPTSMIIKISKNHKIWNLLLYFPNYFWRKKRKLIIWYVALLLVVPAAQTENFFQNSGIPHYLMEPFVCVGLNFKLKIKLINCENVLYLKKHELRFTQTRSQMCLTLTRWQELLRIFFGMFLVKKKIFILSRARVVVLNHLFE